MPLGMARVQRDAAAIKTNTGVRTTTEHLLALSERIVLNEEFRHLMKERGFLSLQARLQRTAPGNAASTCARPTLKPATVTHREGPLPQKPKPNEDFAVFSDDFMVTDEQGTEPMQEPELPRTRT